MRILAAIATVIVAGLGWLYNQIAGATKAQAPTAQQQPAEPAPSRTTAADSSSESAGIAAEPRSADKRKKTTKKAPSGGAAIVDAFEKKQSDFFVEATGIVKRLLPDDDDGAKHQNFIVAVTDDHTVKVSHNTDIADPIPLKEGDTIKFRGEYVWNEFGGVIHWTHRDLNGRKAGGWIEHQGKMYK